MRRERFINNAATTLDGGIDDSTTTVTVVDGSVFPAEGDYRVMVDDEIMLVTSRASNDLTVVRGVEGTTAATHSDTAPVIAILTASALIDFIDQADAIGMHGSSHRKPFRLLSGDTPLTTSDFTWVNQGSSSIANDPWGGITATIVETTGDWKLLTRPAPTTPYTLTANMLFGPGATYSVAGTIMAIGFRESSTGKFVAGAVETGDKAHFWRFADPATFSGTATTDNAVDTLWDEYWVQIEDDGTDLKYRISVDGLTYYDIGVDGRTVFMSGGPDELFWGCDPRGSANKLMHLRCWVEQ